MEDTAEAMVWPTFEEDFWPAYDKKVGKPAALKWWDKLTQKEKEDCMAAIPSYVASREKRFRKDPERYLRHKAFYDEVITEAVNTPGNGQGSNLDQKKQAVFESLAFRRQCSGVDDQGGY